MGPNASIGSPVVKIISDITDYLPRGAKFVYTNNNSNGKNKNCNIITFVMGKSKIVKLEIFSGETNLLACAKK